MKKSIVIIVLISLLMMTSQEFQYPLINQLLAEDKHNVLISPISIYQALSIAGNGANGSTQSEIVKALLAKNVVELNKKNQNIIDILKDEANVKIANAVISRSSFKKEFLFKLETFDAYVSQLQNADQVNGWCAKKTNNKITKIIDNVDGVDTIILNAVYFNSSWKYKFDKEKNYLLKFTNYNGEAVEREMMFTETHFFYYEDNEAQVVLLPYKDEKVSGLVFLPKEGVDINKYALELTERKMEMYFKRLRKEKISLSLPKFEIEFESSLKNPLINLGIQKAFSGKADFSNISEHSSIYITDVLHKAYMKVDEEGTEAAAVTSIVMTRSLPPPAREMIVNRPFLFMIKHLELEEMLFIAKIDELKE